MGIQNYFKNTIKANTNVTAWSDWDSIKKNAQIVGGLVKDLKAPDADEPVEKETFEAAVKKYGLTEADLRKQMRSHFIAAMICAFLGAAAIGWMIFLLFKTMFLSAIVSLALSVMMFGYAFSEHFKYFEMKKRKLDCTVREWYAGFFPNKK